MNDNSECETRCDCGLKWYWLGLAALSAIYFFTTLNRLAELPLLDPDEPRYASAGRTMSREAGEHALLVPRFNGEPRINKPPLFYWLVALSDTLAGGATESSSRAPSVAAGLLMLWGTVWLGARIFGRATGLLAGAVLLSTPLFLALSRCCITDMTFSFFMTGAFACLLAGMKRVGGSASRRIGDDAFAPTQLAARRVDPRWGWYASIFLGLAVLTKATPALLIVLAVAIFRALELPRELRPRAARWLPTLLLAAIVLSAIAMQCDYLGKSKASAAHTKAVAAAQASSAQSGAKEDSALAVRRKNNWENLDDVVNKIALACAFCAAGLLLWMAVRSERRDAFLPAMWKAGLATALAMGLWWYALLIYEQGWERFRDLLNFEIKSRIAGAIHREGSYYYLYILLAVVFPWSVGLPAALRTAWPSSDDGGLKASKLPDAARDSDAYLARADIFLLGWMLGVILFFSIPGAKLSTYLLPAMPPVALLLAHYLSRPAASRRWNGVTRALAISIGAILLAFPIYVRWLPREIPDFVSENQYMLWTLACLCALVFGGSWLLAARQKGRSAGIALACAILLMVNIALPNAIEKLKHRSTKELCQAVAGELRGCARVESLGVAVESLSYYLDRHIGEHHWKPPAANTNPVQLIFDILGNSEPSALFIDKHFFPRLFGKNRMLKELSPEEIKRLLPAGLEYVYSSPDVLVLRNKF